MDHTLQLVDSVCNIVGTLFVLGGGIFALLQWRSAIRAQRAETMARLFELCEQKEVYLTFNTYILNAGRLKVTSRNGETEFQDIEKPDRKGADIKTWIDTMLAFFNQVCYMKDHGIIDKDEFDVFERQIRRLFDSSQIKDYLRDLRKDADSASPYDCLVRFAKRNDCLL